MVRSTSSQWEPQHPSQDRIKTSENVSPETLPGWKESLQTFTRALLQCWLQIPFIHTQNNPYSMKCLEKNWAWCKLHWLLYYGIWLYLERIYVKIMTLQMDAFFYQHQVIIWFLDRPKSCNSLCNCFLHMSNHFWRKSQKTTRTNAMHLSARWLIDVFTAGKNKFQIVSKL